MSYRGKHRKMSAATRNIARVAIGALAVGAPLAIAATPAQAEGTNWDAIAQCESSGNWSANTGNGYSGGLQFKDSTWKAYGGKGSAHNASRDEQIAVAERVKAGQGIKAWPSCGKKGGSSASYKGKNTTGAAKKKSAPAVKERTSAPAPQQSAPVTGTSKDNPNGNYTVVAGDTLSKIASANNVQGGWAKLYELNKEFVADADLIIVGQKIATQ